MSRHDSKQIENVKVMLLKGESGSSIAGIAKTGTDGLVDTYTITLTDGSKTTFTVTNGKAITSVAKTGTQGLVDTYTITFNDNSTITFAITNGNGITSLEKTGTQGLVDTYTITFDNGSTQTFTVTNGEDGNGITSIVKTSTSGLVDTYTITFDNGSTETFDVTNGANGSDVSQSNLAPVETDNTASQSYAVGSHLIWNGVYYEVIQAIAVGDSFVIDANIKQDTISAEIENTVNKNGDLNMKGWFQATRGFTAQYSPTSVSTKLSYEEILANDPSNNFLFRISPRVSISNASNEFQHLDGGGIMIQSSATAGAFKTSNYSNACILLIVTLTNDSGEVKGTGAYVISQGSTSKVPIITTLGTSGSAPTISTSTTIYGIIITKQTGLTLRGRSIKLF